MPDNAASKLTLYLSSGILTDGRQYYAYLAGYPDDIRRLKKDEKAGNFCLGDYGEILAGAIGTDEPPLHVVLEVQRLVQQQYIQNNIASAE